VTFDVVTSKLLCAMLAYQVAVACFPYTTLFRSRTRARVELAGIVLLLLPLCLFAVWISLDYVAASWSVREGSRDPGGLPGWYLLKALIPLSAALLALQGLAQAVRAAQRAVGSNDSGA